MLLSREGEEIRGRAASPQKLGLHFHQSSTEKAPPALAVPGSPGSTQQGPEWGCGAAGKGRPQQPRSSAPGGNAKGWVVLADGF